MKELIKYFKGTNDKKVSNNSLIRNCLLKSYATVSILL